MAEDVPLLQDSGRGLSLQYKNRNLYNPADPAAGVRRRIPESLQEDTLYVLFSPLLGYGIKEIQKLLPDSSKLLCVEADPALHSVFTEIFKDDTSISCILTTSPEPLISYLTSGGIWRFRRVIPLVLNGGYAICKETYELLLSELNKRISLFWRDRMTMIRLGRLWFKNIFRNLPAASLSAPVIVNKCAIAVVGAGLSLEQNIDFISKKRELLYLLCVDTALPVLKSAGVTPDAVIALDGQSINMFDFYGIDLSGTTVYRDITGRTPPLGKDVKHIPLFSGFAESSFIDRLLSSGLIDVEIPPLGSVGVAAVHLASLLSSDAPMLVTGLDFAYPDGKSHAKGSPAMILELTNRNRATGSWLYPFHIRTGRYSLQNAGTCMKSDPIMDQYCLALKTLIQNTLSNRQIYRLAGSHRLSYILRLSPEKEEELFSAEKVYPIAAPLSAAAERQSAPGKRVLAEKFLQQELALVQSVLDQAREYIFGRLTDENRFFRELSKCDYLYLHFPDKPPLPKRDTGFIKRCIVGGERFESHIKSALQELHEF